VDQIVIAAWLYSKNLMIILKLTKLFLQNSHLLPLYIFVTSSANFQKTCDISLVGYINNYLKSPNKFLILLFFLITSAFLILGKIKQIRRRYLWNSNNSTRILLQKYHILRCAMRCKHCQCNSTLRTVAIP